MRSWQLTELTELAAACPDTVIVLNHLGKPRCGTDLAPWRAAIAALAARPNVRCKLSGLATEAAATASRGDLIAALRVALDAFGAGRCLYGGDWPVCTLATSPDAWLDVVLAALDQAHATEAERARGADSAPPAARTGCGRSQRRRARERADDSPGFRPTACHARKGGSAGPARPAMTARVVYTGARTLRLEPRPRAAGAGQVRVDVAYTGICGTDLHIYHGDMDARVRPPAPIGHEMSGRVAAVGPGRPAGRPATR